MATDMGGFAQAGGPYLVDRFGRRLPSGFPFVSSLRFREDKVTAAGGEATFYLACIPYKNEIQLFKNGLLISPPYTISGNAVTIYPAATAGDVFVCCYRTADQNPNATPTIGGTTATLNPSDCGGNLVLSNGNLTLTTDGTGVGTGRMCRATIYMSTAKKYYWEAVGTFTTGTESLAGGVSNSSQPLGNATTPRFDGDSTNSVGLGYFGDGTCWYNNTLIATISGGVASGTYLGYTYDGPSGTVRVTKDGTTWLTVKTGLSGLFTPSADVARSTSSITFNFGATAFHYAVPAGFQGGVY